MEWIEGVAALVLGLVIRLGIPVLITVLLVRGLRRLDERWQAEAEVQRSQAASTPKTKKIKCWEIKGCAAEQRAACQAHARPECPCWQTFRDDSGHLQERCLGCEVFRESPVPIPVTTI
jgi:hypothetical protein